MTEQEGVIKYQLAFSPGVAPAYERFAELNYWRCYLYRLGLIGQDPARYGGLGYGNISGRVRPGTAAFVISATQTGHLPLLCRDHYAEVTDFDLARNALTACGVHPPSSEALTHASIYACRDDVNCVMHVHCPVIWRRAEALQLMLTAPDIAYGTPQMASAVQALVQSRAETCGVIAMTGHEDGLLIYGADEQEAGALVMDLLQHAANGATH